MCGILLRIKNMLFLFILLLSFSLCGQVYGTDDLTIKKGPPQVVEKSSISTNPVLLNTVILGQSVGNSK